MKVDDDYDPDSIFRDLGEEPLTFEDEEVSEEVLEDDPNDFMHSTDDEDDAF